MAPRSPFCKHMIWRYVSTTCIILSAVATCLPFAFAGFQFGDVDLFASNGAVVIGAWWATTIIWNVTVIGYESHKRRPIVPAAVVAMDLLVWLYGLAALAWEIYILTWVCFSFWWWPAMDAYWRQQKYGWAYPRSLPEDGLIVMIVTLSVNIAVILMTTIINFVFFVGGCKDEDARRKLIKNLVNGDRAANGEKVLVTADGELFGCDETIDSSNITVRSPPRYSASEYSSKLLSKQMALEEMEASFGRSADDIVENYASSSAGYPTDKGEKSVHW